ncbi:MAG: hypothetical protein OEZ68_18845 [Gammaproteobacteria bacterium]|nr:hypothetical protein [Gammaproteobacteria bacterium]MDH5802865.1 hypothetical protein [Gammaproteobacteria bacterium]
MNTRLLSKIVLMGALIAPITTWACDAAGPSTHIGNVLSVDAGKKTFTIRDAQSNSPITFAASNEIIDGLKGAKGSVMVNYEDSDDGGLKAVGVTF